MKHTIFKLQDGTLIERYQMPIKNPYTPINFGEKVIINSKKYRVSDVIHIPNINTRQIILEIL